MFLTDNMKTLLKQMNSDDRCMKELVIYTEEALKELKNEQPSVEVLIRLAEVIHGKAMRIFIKISYKKGKQFEQIAACINVSTLLIDSNDQTDIPK